MADSDPASVVVSADPRFRVLARKYRPATFATLIGQEALVRTLSNAFQAGRIAHAYMLAGVRGVGKTTTARIIARALNCIGPDGSGGVTINPCGVCEHCVAIIEDRHLDVIEMDAASHTGVDNIRELLDGVPYRPALARYKVYIIDEVHMLSEKAFNALLKTLEEPPEHVKFVFATTEIRKVPVTVLSRCQRFDLRRVEAAALMIHLRQIAREEQVSVAPEALQLLARAADGSVRDALSLLDQAIAHGAEVVDEVSVREMLGLVDRSLCFDILDAVMRGDAPAALAILGDQYRSGADPVTILEDLLELTHWLTRIKLAPESAAAQDVPEAERVRGRRMADRLGMADVTRAWQMLLKGLSETRLAPVPLHATEMVLIRLAYASQLPSPAEALEALVGGNTAAPRGGPADGSPTGSSSSARSAWNDPSPQGAPAQTSPSQGANAWTSCAAPGGARSATASAAIPNPADASLARRPLPPKLVEADSASISPAPNPLAAAAAPPPGRPPASFADVVDLARDRHEGMLHGHLMTDVHLVRFEPGRVELRLGAHAAADLPQRLSRFLLAETGKPWLVTVSHEAGEPSLHEQQTALQAAQLAEVSAHPLVRSIFEMFPGSVIQRITIEPPPPADAGEADVTDGVEPAEDPED